jgi:hypothetical protein
MPNFRITIDVKDVAGGDVDMLAQDILDEHGMNFDASKGDFTIIVSQKVGDNFYMRDPGDDVIG